MSQSLAQTARLRPAPAHRGHVRETALAVALFFAALAFAAAVSAPAGNGAPAEPGCAGACWERIL
jgi:hypothetical protein